MTPARLTVAGGGNMGASLVRGVLKSGLLEPAAVTVIEPAAERARQLAAELGVETLQTAADLSEPLEALLVAVKPQIAAEVCREYQAVTNADTLVLSCMAGKTLEDLSKLFPATQKLVRFMPNLPAQVGAAISVYICSPGVAAEDRKFVEQLLDSSGASLRVLDEEKLDAATAVSGSGTGYVAYFAEAMVATAQELGFSYDESVLLVGKTISGAVELWLQRGDTPQALREAVTSPGGTTQAALETFERQGVGKGIRQGMCAAFARSREL